MTDPRSMGLDVYTEARSRLGQRSISMGAASGMGTPQRTPHWRCSGMRRVE